MEDLAETFRKCWKILIGKYKLRSREFVFFSESDIHRALANLLEKERVGHVHVEFPIPLDPNELWGQIEKFGKVAFRKGYYRADVCVLVEEIPRLISEIRWMPALIPPFQFLNKQNEKVKLAQEKLKRTRKKYEIAIPRRYADTVSRNLGKFLEVLKRYGQYYGLEGYLCVIDELCPSIDRQLRKEIERFDVADNFHLLADYIE